MKWARKEYARGDFLNYRLPVEKIKQIERFSEHRIEIYHHLVSYCATWGAVGLAMTGLAASKKNAVEKLLSLFEKVERFRGRTILNYRQTEDREVVESIFKDFDDLDRIGPTVAAKFLHALNPLFFPPCDAAILDKLGYKGDYMGFFERCKKIYEDNKDLIDSEAAKYYSDLDPNFVSQYERDSGLPPSRGVDPLYALDKYFWIVANNKMVDDEGAKITIDDQTSTQEKIEIKKSRTQANLEELTALASVLKIRIDDLPESRSAAKEVLIKRLLAELGSNKRIREEMSNNHLWGTGRKPRK
ncbi:MAG: hypothetical protein Q6373_024350 [Candidatus Sigynarchaeota archaeon]